MKRRSIVLCCVINLMSAVCITIIGPTLPQLSKDFQLTLSGMGALFTFQFIGFTVFVVASGLISDYIGKKSVVTGSLIMLTASCFFLSGVRSYGALCVTLLFLGGGMGILETMSNALLADIDPDNSVFLLNFLQVFFGLGAILGPVAAGVAYSEHISWRVVYQAVGVILIVVTVWFILNKLPPLPKAEKIRVGDVRALLGDGGFLTICFCIFAYTGAESSGWGWLSTYAEKNLSFSAAESGAAVAVFWTAVTAGRFLIALTLKKFDLRKLIAALSLSSAVVCVIMGVLHQKIFAWIVVILLGLACSSQWGLILSFGAERYKRNSGSVFAILLASGGFGMALVPYLTGLAGDLAGMRISLFVPASMFASIAILFSIKYN